MQITELNHFLGNIDIYLLDQILKNRFHPKMKVLDAGCGEGRNLMYFINSGYPVDAIDINPEAVRVLQFLARSKRPDIEKDQFQVGDLAHLPYSDQAFDFIIVSAVLHFARDHDHFEAMFKELFRCLSPNGILFIRMASNIGIEKGVEAIEGGRYALPDGSDRYLLTREMLKKLLANYALKLLEPFKTVNVQDQRCMSTLVLTKP